MLLFLEARSVTSVILADIQENEDQQRSSLFQSKADIAKGKQDKRDANSAYQIGKDLDGMLCQVNCSTWPHTLETTRL